jgi:TPR repeat protein
MHGQRGAGAAKSRVAAVCDPFLVLAAVADGAVSAQAEPTTPTPTQCDLLAASAFDKARPANVPGIPSGKIDAARAIQACREAIKQDPSPRIYYQLGRAMEAGRDSGGAFRYYKYAAERGHAHAQNQLGYLAYVQGDYSSAIMWFQKAVAQGDADAEANLGSAYQKGQGVAPDLSKAAHWYQQSADQNDAYGQYELALMYQYGRGVPQNTGLAVTLLKQAAMQGMAEAQKQLASIETSASPQATDSQPRRYSGQETTGIASADGPVAGCLNSSSDQSPEAVTTACTRLLAEIHEREVAGTLSPDTRKVVHVVFFQRARGYVTESRYNDALSDINEAIRLAKMISGQESAIVEYRGLRGCLLSNMSRDLDLAISDLDVAVRGDKASQDRKYAASAFECRGNAYLAKGLPSRAVQDFSKSLELQPGNQEVLNLLASAQRKTDTPQRPGSPGTMHTFICRIPGNVEPWVITADPGQKSFGIEYRTEDTKMTLPRNSGHLW